MENFPIVIVPRSVIMVYFSAAAGGPDHENISRVSSTE